MVTVIVAQTNAHADNFRRSFIHSKDRLPITTSFEAAFSGSLRGLRDGIIYLVDLDTGDSNYLRKLHGIRNQILVVKWKEV